MRRNAIFIGGVEPEVAVAGNEAQIRLRDRDAVQPSAEGDCQ